MFKHILVAVDGSDCSHHALDVAVTLAKEQGARCSVVIVVDIVGSASSMAFATGEIVNEWIKTLSQEAQEIGAQALAKYVNSGVNIESTVVKGYPSEAIIEVAKKTGAALVVMGSHGRSGLKRLWLGSVAESVVREAPVPVMIVR